MSSVAISQICIRKKHRDIKKSGAKTLGMELTKTKMDNNTDKKNLRAAPENT